MKTKLFNKVAECAGIAPHVLKEKCRKRELVQYRQMYFKIAYENNQGSYESIGSIVGKNHATVIHGIKTINNLIETDFKIREEFKRVQEECLIVIDIKNMLEWSEFTDENSMMHYVCTYKGLKVAEINEVFVTVFFVKHIGANGMTDCCITPDKLEQMKEKTMKEFLEFVRKV